MVLLLHSSPQNACHVKQLSDVSTGARFAKWRAVLKIADGGPSLEAMESNAHGLAAYAKIAQVGFASCEVAC